MDHLQQLKMKSQKSTLLALLNEKIGYDISNDYGKERIDVDIGNLTLKTIENYIEICDDAIYGDLNLSSSIMTQRLLNHAGVLVGKLKKARDNHPETIRRRQQAEEEEQRKREEARKCEAKGLCAYCDGEIAGIFSKKCKKCNLPTSNQSRLWRKKSKCGRCGELMYSDYTCKKCGMEKGWIHLAE